jgi:uncharacterized protein (DUF885 family)
MRTETPALLLAAGCSLAACASLATTRGSVEARVAAQNALFEGSCECALATHPECAPAHGDYRYNDRLDEYSLAAIMSAHASEENFLQRLKAIRTSGFSEQDTLSHEVLVVDTGIHSEGWTREQGVDFFRKFAAVSSRAQESAFKATTAN